MVQWVDWAERQSWGKDGGSFTGGPAKGLFHTTETRTWPGYGMGSVAPHLTVLPLPMERKLVWRQHSPLDRAARALRNESGGVQTNRDGVRQIELIGTCDPVYAARWPDAFKWYDAPEWALQQLAEKVKWLSDNCGIALQSVPKPWLPYPQSYGHAHGQRLSLPEWDNFGGWCGHMHAAENTHGDPGSFNAHRVIELAGGILASPVTPARPPAVAPATIPNFPLPSGHVFGPKQGSELYHSGYYSANDRKWLRLWQAKAREREFVIDGRLIDVDGLYGNQCRVAANYIQRLYFGRTDGIRTFGNWRAEFGLIGPNTWRAMWLPRP